MLPSLLFCNYVILGGHILNISKTDNSSGALQWTTWCSFAGIYIHSTYVMYICM